MSRAVASTITAELAGTIVKPIALAQFNFDSGNLNLWTGYGDLDNVETATGVFETFNGSGDLGSVGEVMETQEVKATGVDFQLSGIPSSIIATALTENYQDRLCSLWLGFMDSSNALIDKVLLFKGRMDIMTIEETGETSNISVTAESILIALERPNERRFTHEDQKLDYPSDLGFEMVVDLQQRELVWGRQ